MDERLGEMPPIYESLSRPAQMLTQHILKGSIVVKDEEIQRPAGVDPESTEDYGFYTAVTTAEIHDIVTALDITEERRDNIVKTYYKDLFPVDPLQAAIKMGTLLTRKGVISPLSIPTRWNNVDTLRRSEDGTYSAELRARQIPEGIASVSDPTQQGASLRDRGNSRKDSASMTENGPTSGRQVRFG